MASDPSGTGDRPDRPDPPWPTGAVLAAAADRRLPGRPTRRARTGRTLWLEASWKPRGRRHRSRRGPRRPTAPQTPAQPRTRALPWTYGRLPAAPVPPDADDGRVPCTCPPTAPGCQGPGRRTLRPPPPDAAPPARASAGAAPAEAEGARVPGPGLDERATADGSPGSAPIRAWFPVLRPALDRWLHLDLVHDTAPPCRFGALGARTPRRPGPVGHLPHGHAAPGHSRRARPARSGPHRRPSVTLVVSDCMAAVGRPGEAGDRWYRTLRHWAAHLPLPSYSRCRNTCGHHGATGHARLLTARSAAAATARPRSPPTTRRPAAARFRRTPPGLERGRPGWRTGRADRRSGRRAHTGSWPGCRPRPRRRRTRPGHRLVGRRGLVLRSRDRVPGAFRLAATALPSRRCRDAASCNAPWRSTPRPQHLAEIILSGHAHDDPRPPGLVQPSARRTRSAPALAASSARGRPPVPGPGGPGDRRAGGTGGRGVRAEVRGAGTGTPPGGFRTVSAETVAARWRRGAGCSPAVPADRPGPGPPDDRGPGPADERPVIGTATPQRRHKNASCGGTRLSVITSQHVVPAWTSG